MRHDELTEIEQKDLLQCVRLWRGRRALNKFPPLKGSGLKSKESLLSRHLIKKVYDGSKSGAVTWLRTAYLVPTNDGLRIANEILRDIYHK